MTGSERGLMPIGELSASFPYATVIKIINALLISTALQQNTGDPI